MTRKEDEILARQHVTWYMKRLREQFEAWAGITEQLMVDNFIHGMKHAREEKSVDPFAPRKYPTPLGEPTITYYESEE